MANLTMPSNTLVFVKKNWFQISITILLLYLLVSRDLTFSVNFQSPANNEQIDKVKRKEVMTDASPPTASATEEKLNFMPSTSSSTANSLINIDESKKVEYLKRFARVVVEEQKKFDVPASVLLAVGMLQSKAGTAEFTKVGNNQFALRCFDNWSGEKMQLEGQCFRKYKTAWLSFRDNSQYLTQGKFKNLSRIGSRDYKNWAKGLEELRFSTEPNFANQIVQIIEMYNLAELDK